MKKVMTFLIFLLGLAGCGLETQTLTQFYDGDLSKVTKVTIVDGNTGYSRTVTDPSLVKEFLDDIKHIKFIPDDNQQTRDGFNYSITFYENNMERFSFSLGQVEGDYYHTEPDLYPIVDAFYKRLKTNKK